MVDAPSVSSMEDLLASDVPLPYEIVDSSDDDMQLKKELKSNSNSTESMVLLDRTGEGISISPAATQLSNHSHDMGISEGSDDVDADLDVDDLIKEVGRSLKGDDLEDANENPKMAAEVQDEVRTDVVFRGWNNTPTSAVRPILPKDVTKVQSTSVEKDIKSSPSVSSINNISDEEDEVILRKWSMSPKPIEESSKQGEPQEEIQNSIEKSTDKMKKNPLDVWNQRRQKSNKGSLWQGVRWSPSKNIQKVLAKRASSGEEAVNEPSQTRSKTVEMESSKENILAESSNFEAVKSKSKEYQIGTLKMEILSCTNIAKFDRYSWPNITAYMVCGDTAFATDSVTSPSPMWSADSKRAAEFPLFHAYARIFIGIFNATDKDTDDFAGRVVINMASLRQNVQYDVNLPLKVSSTIYDQRKRGFVRLRFSLHWSDERFAVLSYLPKSYSTLPWVGDPTKSNTVTVPCADKKTLRNVTFTVFGEDLPSKFSRKAFRGSTREMGLYKINVQNAIRKTMRSIMLYDNLFVSLYAFAGWMVIAYYNKIYLVPSFVLSFIVITFYHNYASFLDRSLSTPDQSLSLADIASMLISGHSEDDSNSSTKSNSASSDEYTERIRFAEDHYEVFPFSNMPGPEQDNDIEAKEGNVFKKNFEDLEKRMHSVTGNMLHQYITKEVGKDPKKTFPENQTKFTNPLVAVSASFIEPVMKPIEVYLLAVRCTYHAFTWKDPFFSFWIVIFLIISMLILAIFPWRKLFLLAGILSVGPQNFMFKTLFEERCMMNDNNSSEQRESLQDDGTPPPENDDPQYISSDMFKTAHSVKWQKQNKKSQYEPLHEVIIPYKILDLERFCFWPPQFNDIACYPKHSTPANDDNLDHRSGKEKDA